jgi:dihydroneopterin aldolase
MTPIPLSDPLLRDCRRLFLRGLSRPVRIGIHDFERTAPQRIIFDIDLYVPLAQSTPQRDHIDEVVDYDFVRHAVSDLIEKRHIELQETLCDALLDALLAHPQVVAARVSTRKPDVYPDCDAVGVEVFRSKTGASQGQ